jgi:hypothetical protein
MADLAVAFGFEDIVDGARFDTGDGAPGLP